MTLTYWQRLRLANDWWLYPIERWKRDLPMTLAFMLPRSIALWAFIRVYGADGQGPTREYEQKYKFWQAQTMRNKTPNFTSSVSR